MKLGEIDDPNSYRISAKTKLRPGVKAGLWCGLVLPLAMILSLRRPYLNDMTAYKLSTLGSFLSALYIYLKLFRFKAATTHITGILTTLFFCWMWHFQMVDALYGTLVLLLAGSTSYLFLQNLLKCFPCCFSLGEAIFVIQGALAFIVVTLVNCIILGTGDYRSFATSYEGYRTDPSAIFSQVLLLSVGVFLFLTRLSQHFQRLLSFTLLFLAVVAAFTFPVTFLIVQKDPISWLLIDFLQLRPVRVHIVLYWLACTIVALIIAWRFGGVSATSTKLTILRKYFHGVIVAIYLPGILIDIELLFAASIFALAAFILLEAIRLYNLEYIGAVLNRSTAGFLDEKDQGILILTPIYLLVGCSLPIWISPGGRNFFLDGCGIISLGIGDTAASIGGTLWGRTKLPGSPKTVEGTLCSIFAEIIFVYTVTAFGTFQLIPGLNFLVAVVATSLVEAFTTQVDNLVLPLVMYIIMLI